MRYVLPAGFVLTLLLKIHVLGITGAGLLTLAQLGLTYGSDRFSARRDLKRDNFTTYITPDGLVVQTLKENR